MKLCSSYKIPVSLWASLDEIRFSTSNLGGVITYITEHPDKRVILEILSLTTSSLTTDQLVNLIQEYPNLYYDFYELDDFLLLERQIPGRFMYHFPVNTYNMLYFLLQYEISDVTIGEPLNFDLKQVYTAVHSVSYEHPIQVRVQPAVGRPTLFNEIKDVDNGIRHFWILPQHIKYFEPYIDVLDLLDNNTERERTLVQVFLRGEYGRELKYFLKNSESDMLGKLITEGFVDRRLVCRQRCLQTADGDICHYCTAEEDLYKKILERQNSDNPL